jgi:predicted  nucleic acid-binding Zn-ribbon protein
MKINMPNQNTLTITLVSIAVVLIALATLAIFTPPSEAKQLEQRMRQIAVEAEQLRFDIQSLQFEWAGLDEEHQQLLLQVQLYEAQKSKIEEKAAALRTQHEVLIQERTAISGKLLDFRLGQ